MIDNKLTFHYKLWQANPGPATLESVAEELLSLVRALVRRELHLVEEDLELEITEWLLAHLEGFRGDCPIEAWVAQKVNYKILDYFRELRKYPEISLEEMSQNVTELPSQVGEMSRMSQMSLDLEAFLGGCTPLERLLVEARIEGKTFKEISLEENLPFGMVISKWYQLRPKLLELLPGRHSAKPFGL